MFYNLKIILRNLRRGGIYSAINIGGLAIGMAAAILILAWTWHQWSYDRFHTKEKQLYVAYNRILVGGSIQCSDWTSMPLGPTLKTDYPEIAGVARMIYDDYLYAGEDVRLKIRTGCTDPDFLTMFDFPLLHGNKETALNDPQSVILTESAAIRLFGTGDPIGQTLLVNNQHPVTVTGVMKDLPGNTRFQSEAFMPVSFLKILGRFIDSWGTNNLQTYVELHPDARPEQVNESIRGVNNSHTGNRAQTEVFLYPLGKRYLYAKFENGEPVGGMIDTLRLFGIIAGLVLLIACINFMNLSTARSAKRAKEVGVRKVLGGKRMSLIRLFLGESMLVALIAGAVALILAMMVLPEFSTLMGQQLTLNPANGWFWVAGSGFVLFTGLLAGSYPAFYLSSFRPVKVLKGLFSRQRGAISSRKVLVVTQFTVACALIVSTLVVHRQIEYALDRESGYNKDQLIYMMLDGDIGKNYELIKNDLITSGVAVSVTKNSGPMTQGWNNTWGVTWKGKDPDARITFEMLFADSGWSKTVGATIIEGRDIDVYAFPTDSSAMLLNESAVKIMNFENPVGEIVSTQGRDWHVVGVVKDFILNSPYERVAPMFIGGPSGWFGVMHIRLNGVNRMAGNLAETEQTFKRYNPAYPFEYRFVDEEYARKFGEVQQLGTLATWFAGLAIFISCLGLFALVAYIAETRRKEIGIRKVLGASVGNVILLLSKEFLMLVLISVAVASPIAWWAMNQWLSGYAYRTDIPWWLFVVVGCISVGIALLTVGFQAVKAATANPVKAISSSE
ncbi:MAG: ABC transporter permease [Tannerella sp.]|jgi:ABC-type antimicrobial peptide transport system permease subunit|nr:ABC transporter permease [Tannerella sp.]